MIIFASSKNMFFKMARIKLHDKYFVTSIPNEEIERAICAVGRQISEDYRDKDCPVFLSVLNGSFMFTASLMKSIEIQAELSFIKLSSYDGTESTGCVRQLLGLNKNIKGRNVLIVEDIVDTGNTIVELVKLLQEAGAADIKVCTLLLKPDSYDKEIKIDYPAIKIPNDFIVGYGLDYDELGRQYKDIYVLDPNQD